MNIKPRVQSQKKDIACWDTRFAVKSVVERSLAQRMKEKGWSKETFFQFYIDEHMKGRWGLGHVYDELIIVQAPTAGEILEELIHEQIFITKVKEGFSVNVKNVSPVVRYRLVDALAEAWIEKQTNGGNS
jgi:hypothetical protein